MLLNIINAMEIKKIVDVGCGDWEFSKNIDWTESIDYTGIDVVKSVIERNKEKYESENIRFRQLDIFAEPHLVEGYDLVILKDVIQHWDDSEIETVMTSLCANNKFVFLTNGYKFGRTPEKNGWTERDINNKYHYHPVDIQKKPLKDLNLNVLFTDHRRYKQFNLIEGNNLSIVH